MQLKDAPPQISLSKVSILPYTDARDVFFFGLSDSDFLHVDTWIAADRRYAFSVKRTAIVQDNS